LAALFMAGVVLLGSCSLDVSGLFASKDLFTRLSGKDTFKFLTDADRSLSLPDEYSFIVLSDTHIEKGNAYGLEKLASVIDGARFVVINGDITQSGSRDDVKKFIEIARSLGVPCYPVLGNHDIYFKNWTVWEELIGSTCYRVDSPTSGTSLFFLDSANGMFGMEQLDWLAEELKSAKGHVFVFTHTNLFVESPVDLVQLTDTRERARMVSLLEGRCDAFFMGHLHRRVIKEIGGVGYITTEDYRSNKTYCRVYVSEAGFRYEFKQL
jgi:3',5'-cyclic AMP phosphodiesterase CpdA